MYSAIERKLKNDIKKFRLDASKAMEMSIDGEYKPNTKGYENMEKVYDTLNRMSIGKNFKVIYEFYKLISGIGSVSLIGKNIKIPDTEFFSKFIDMVGLEVCPKTDGTVVINFTFNNLDKDLSN